MAAVSDEEMLRRVRLIRRELLGGEVAAAYTLVVSLDHALAYGLDTLPYLLDDSKPEPAAIGAEPGVQTAETANERLGFHSHRYSAYAAMMDGPTEFSLIVTGAVEGQTRAELYSTARNDSERQRLLAWIADSPELAQWIGEMLIRFG